MGICRFRQPNFLKSFDCCKLQKLLVVSFISEKALLLRIQGEKQSALDSSAG